MCFKTRQKIFFGGGFERDGTKTSDFLKPSKNRTESRDMLSKSLFIKQKNLTYYQQVT
jgi:hypothetical protein